MIKILLSGASGNMGKAVTRAVAQNPDATICAGFDIRTEPTAEFPIYDDLCSVTEPVDVIIDFSHPSMLDRILDYAVSKKIPAVICTTGLSAEQVSRIQYEAKNIPIFFSANMSLGVNLLIDLVARASKILEDTFDIEIIEKHHNQKLDAPSGTALAIANAISDTVSYEAEYTYDRHSVRKKRDKREIGIHAVRGGTIVGEHEVLFAGTDEVISLKHTATSKEVFAVGALKASFFLKEQKPGLYAMKDLIAAQ
ncbi:MAG: 4-hydroxy-tetrahydrodipicolinate reductase [Clostridia bacterium]|nr:4-hydroxy-tetrahydrodipicolinate reductase [Clostridia bacterium]